jgi:hypothetical protein
MSLSTQSSQIAFKILNGKSQTDNTKSILEEQIGISFNLTSDNVWLDTIYPDPTITTLQGSAILITANLTQSSYEGVSNTNGKAFRAIWPLSISGTDIKTGQPFQYGVGSLLDINSGQPVLGAISDSYGSLYQAKPYAGPTAIPSADAREWFYQYNSGVFYQVNTTYTSPTTIQLYVYIGDKLSTTTTNNQQNIRLTAFGTNSYFATYSIPTISNYSTNHLYLVDFINSNTSSNVSLNINSLGTISVFKSTSSGPSSLDPGDIIGSSQSSQVYYLTYNGQEFQLYGVNPISSSNKYTNPDFTFEKVGGLEKSTSFDNVPLQDVFSGLLYPNTLGNILTVTFSNGELNKLELGQPISPNTWNLYWTTQNVLNSTYTIRDISQGVSASEWPKFDILGTVSNSPFSWNLGTTISSTYSRSRDFRIEAKRPNGTIVTKPINLTWMPKIYYGSSTFSTLTQSDIISLSSDLFTNSLGIWTMPGQGFKYLVVPNSSEYNFNSITSLGLPVALDGPTFSNGLDFTTITISNTYGIGLEYRIYKTKNKIDGTYSININ